MTGKWLVLVTCANEREASRIARALVGERVAACVAIGKMPVLSIYRWKGKVERGRETLLLVKTSARLFPKVERRVRQLHSYETPEIIALPVVAGSRAYLAWMDASLSASARRAHR
jgi:periplasmic divalent cation tolerance protein